jgi:hypothetical protein
MTNYDYNKGYRGFRFKKDNNIDQKLPALRNYLATRESSSIHWITHSERVIGSVERTLAPQRDRFLGQITDNTNSLSYFPRIVSTTPFGSRSMCVSGQSHVPDEGSMETMFESGYALAPINMTPASLSPREIKGETLAKRLEAAESLTASRRMPQDFPYDEIKTRKQSNRLRSRKQTNQNKNHDIVLRNKQLEECLVIQNGIERTTSKSVGENIILTKEKTQDINYWMDKMSYH